MSRLSVGSSRTSSGPGQLEQQDLQPRLLTSGQRLETLLGGLGQFVPIELARGFLTAHPGAVVITAMKDLQQSAPNQLGMMMGLCEPAGSDPSAQPDPAGVTHRGDDPLAHRPVLRVRVGTTPGQ